MIRLAHAVAFGVAALLTFALGPLILVTPYMLVAVGWLMAGPIVLLAVAIGALVAPVFAAWQFRRGKRRTGWLALSGVWIGFALGLAISFAAPGSQST